MKTKLDYYRVFHETAVYGSFSTAAEKLYISQSAISQCIHQLEEDLGTKLFHRSRRGVTLTQEGQMLLPKVESAIAAISQGETLLAQFRNLHAGSLKIAAGDTITEHYLLPFLEEFHTRYPAIRIEMANSYSANLVGYVKEGKSELAFVNLPTEDDELTVTPCMEIHDIFVAGPAFAAKSSYTREEISAEPLILLEQNATSRRYVEDEFKKNRILLSPIIELAVHDLLIQFASIHLGVSCVVKEFAKDSIRKGIIKPLKLTEPLPARSIGYAYLKHNPLSLAAQAFLDIIKEKQGLKQK
ncbi:MAG: LysR family transcriptional regulator [Clostridia bacterium]|nr:LysR family transcriptional regulator [Oscillospiraceae bacterium]MBQ7033080.1 LysR family transcriptional regulator [Clostridia bacterium]